MNSYDTKDLVPDTELSDEVFLEETFFLLNNVNPIKPTLLNMYTLWNFRITLSKGRPIKPKAKGDFVTDVSKKIQTYIELVRCIKDIKANFGEINNIDSIGELIPFLRPKALLQL